MLRRYVPLTLYAVVLMTAYNVFGHGTQDLYPRCRQAQHHITGITLTAIAVSYNIGAMLGGLVFGTLSQRIGRRWAIGIASILSLARCRSGRSPARRG